MAMEETDYKKNFQWPWRTVEDEQRKPDVMNNPAVTSTRPADAAPMRESHLRAEYPRNYEHMKQFPLPSMAPRVFPQGHKPFTELYRDKVRIRKPKYG